MGRPRTAKYPKPAEIEPEDVSQEQPDEDTDGAGQEGHGIAASNGDGPNKSEAARQAIKAGHDKPATALPWIKKTFGIEMGATHFSAIKSQYLKKQAAAPAKAEPAKRGPKPRDASSAAIETFVAAPTKKVAEGDLLDALTAMKPLIAQYGAEQVKKMVDLLG
jgi:hypothetical protein